MSSLLTLPTLLLLFTTILILSRNNKFPRLEFYARILASHAALLLCAAYGLVASVVLRLVGYGQVSQWAAGRAFKWVMWMITGVRFVVVSGKENLSVRPAVFVGNHQTELDVLCLGTIFPPYCSVTAKRSLKRVPVLGWFMALSKTVFIDRANRQTAMAAFNSAAAEMRRDRQSVYIFPEGTRSYFTEPDLLPFKKGAFHLAIQAKVPIVPVVVANYTHILDMKRKRFKKGDIPVSVLPPIPTAHLEPADVEDLARITRERMLDELIRLTERVRSEIGASHHEVSLRREKELDERKRTAVNGKELLGGDDDQKTVVNGGHGLSDL